MQRYSLEFSFHHVVHTGAGISSSYAHLRTTPGRYRAALAFQFGIQLLLRDAEHAIADGVRKEVQLTINQFGPTSQTNERLTNLNTWIEVDDIQKKFSHYSPQYRQLAYAITNTFTAAGRPPPLPGVNRPAISPHVIGQSLFAKANKGPTKSGRARVMTGAPLFQGGSFNRILSPLIHMVCQQIGLSNPTEADHKNFVGDTAINVFNHLRITIIPWSDVDSGSGSAWSLFNSWITISTSSQSAHARTLPRTITFISDDEVEIISITDPDTVPHQSTSRSAGHRSTAAFTDSWVPSIQSLLELPTQINITLRPDELELISSQAQEMHQIVKDNYEWVYSEYSTQKPIHKLSFIVASVMTRMAPSYMVAPHAAPLHQPPAWTSTRSSTRYPLQAGPLTFGWWLMYLVTMLDSNSPLRQGLQPVVGKRRLKLGAEWVDSMSKKYSTSSNSHFIHLAYVLTFLQHGKECRLLAL